jgi:hypothetical protein
MSYIVQRQDRFYVVANHGLDPTAGKDMHFPRLTGGSDRWIISGEGRRLHVSS